MPSVLWRCWLGGRKGIRPAKNLFFSVCFFLSYDNQTCMWPSWCHCHSLVSCFSKIQIGFAFLVPAHPGNPGKRAVKRVCVCVCVHISVLFHGGTHFFIGSRLAPHHGDHESRSAQCTPLLASFTCDVRATPVQRWRMRREHVLSRVLPSATETAVTQTALSKRKSARSPDVGGFRSRGPIYKISYDNLTIILR